MLGVVAARRRTRRRRRCATAKPPTSSRQCTRAIAEQWDRSRDRSDEHVATGPARRHLHPAPGAHVARIPRERARRRRHPVPRRDQLARLRQPRGARPARACSRAIDDPTDALALVERAALLAVRLRRRRSLHVPRRARRPWDVTRPLPEALPADHPVAEAMRVPRGVAPATHRGSRRASCSSASSRTGTCSSSALAAGRFRDIARRIRFVVDQAARVRRSDVGDAARVPRVGAPPGRRRVRASSRRCCPRPTTTRCAS